MPSLLARPGAATAVVEESESAPSALAIADLLPQHVQERANELPVAAAAEAMEAEVEVVEATVNQVTDSEPEAIADLAPEPAADEPSEVAMLAPQPVDIELGGEVEGFDLSLQLTESDEIPDLEAALAPELGAMVLDVQDAASPELEELASVVEAEVQTPAEATSVEIAAADRPAGGAGEGSELGEQPDVALAVVEEWAPIPDDDHAMADDEADVAPMADLTAPLDLSPFDHETGERLSVVVESAPEALETLVMETDAQAAALEVLEQVGRLVRSGELRVAPSGASAESVLASILAALLSPRS